MLFEYYSDTIWIKFGHSSLDECLMWFLGTHDILLDLSDCRLKQHYMTVASLGSELLRK